MSSTEKFTGHIVFDCDGTLISSMEGIFKGIQLFMTDHLQREVSREEVVANYHADMRVFADNFGMKFDSQDQANAVLNKFITFLNRPEYKYDLFNGVKELILKLSELGYRLYVWTGRDRASTLRILKELDVAKYFFDFRCMDDTIPKPHPMGLEQLVGEYDRSKIIMIGDSVTDIQGAKKFGCRSIGALWCTYSYEDDLKEMEADFLVRSPLDCLEIIEKNI
ncbi:HAD family hydrolase [Halobacteriovorax sp. HLS]|uniref:HAD family hydrolase n=1 Tax=Halobacteriovorax sp. HLS TaxID=2234000 RepID=UPI0013E40B70|nr:HAD family hydrolase [Halobacteriovorax sp. HLS]